MTEHTLSRSRFTAERRCHRLLWWTVHEPDAGGLHPDKALQELFDHGARWAKPHRSWSPARDAGPGTPAVDADTVSRPAQARVA
jgi:hypothetical protein